jgi:hypothetical protein
MKMNQSLSRTILFLIFSGLLLGESKVFAYENELCEEFMALQLKRAGGYVRWFNASGPDNQKSCIAKKLKETPGSAPDAAKKHCEKIVYDLLTELGSKQGELDSFLAKKKDAVKTCPRVDSFGKPVKPAAPAVAAPAGVPAPASDPAPGR